MKKLLLVLTGIIISSAISFSQQFGNYDYLYSHLPESVQEDLITSNRARIHYSMNKNNSFDTPLTIENYDVDILQNETLYKVYEFTYLASGQIQSQTRKDAALVNERRTTYSFNGSSDVTSIVYENWNGAFWDFDYRVIWEYTPSGNLYTETYEDHNGTDWVLNSKTQFEYTGNESTPSMLSATYTEDNITWEDNIRVLYTYAGATPNKVEIIIFDQNYLNWYAVEKWEVTEWGPKPFYPDFLFNQRIAQYKITDALIGKMDQFGIYPSDFEYYSSFDINTGDYTFIAHVDSEFNGNDRTKFTVTEFNGVTYDSTSMYLASYDPCYGYMETVELDYVSLGVWSINGGERYLGYTTPYSTSCQVDAYNYFSNYSDIDPTGVRTRRWVITQAAELSVNEEDLSSSLNIYPNPAAHEVNLEITGVDLDNASYSILSLEGKSLISGSILTNETLIDVNQIPAGVYFIQLDVNGQLATKKFIKE